MRIFFNPGFPLVPGFSGERNPPKKGEGSRGRKKGEIKESKHTDH
jgi:hypothetical protein